MTLILTCNVGSTNTKLAAFDALNLECQQQHSVINTREVTRWLASFPQGDVAAVSHRVVHGGLEFTQPTRITDAVLEKLKRFIPLAPLHQPASLASIALAQQIFPDVPHIACFDTAFHHTIPLKERRLPLPRRFFEEGVLSYGFHGLSYASLAPRLTHDRVIVAHLGGGASACALYKGQSVATTMGFSTLDGLMMSTRCGALDPGVVLYLLEQKHLSAAEITDMLYHESGLKGVSDLSGDMATLLASTDAEAAEAIDLFCQVAAKHIASLLPTLGGLDALVFTGGIGEYALPVREKITEKLRWIGDFSVETMATEEELVLAKACQEAMMREKAISRWENEGGAV
jgi:acetate kinase